ncbi:tRNA (adenosine(37)-N6)-threonylcarbamoyltransferase complex ATPase subunit type 1 TsaE [Mucilaginibacter galii]|uniref:tRNA threonylcarbamoyladenosine biosynthesis protein TsaE n=1 Tax=Mucilaginibacter galii TaxID=2005073 RepID=A0A917J9H7_9SPHI|nr:tRNA (adenosine(37)-N6)-threonylcarbamoyltransferase complex ATPase subunit type 1 TsaE [Mucilaginibacter galii]GGI50971.1 tRNA (adenosine(37)-N6)-threonylcarbamoyltransferase complex ATPase subunit type 1 TsaE [Mucilaginibacter galii]
MTPPVNNLSIAALAELPAAAQSLLNFAGDQKIFLFYGDMGAGKTTFIKALCEQLGVKEPVTSPTFSIVNEYMGSTAQVYHFDFYRLKSQDEALDMGYEEYFYSGNYCLIEWPEKIPDLLPHHYIKVSITLQEQQSRLFTFESI